MLEKEFKVKVMDDLNKLKHCYYLKTQEIGRHGVPDFLLCINGTFVAMELKTDFGVVMKIQDHTLDKIKKAGGYAFVARPKSWSMQYEILRTLDNA